MDDSSPISRFALGAAVGLLIGGCIFAALPLLFRYPITREDHAKIRLRLEALEQDMIDPGPMS